MYHIPGTMDDSELARLWQTPVSASIISFVKHMRSAFEDADEDYTCAISILGSLQNAIGGLMPVGWTPRMISPRDLESFSKLFCDISLSKGDFIGKIKNIVLALFFKPVEISVLFSDLSASAKAFDRPKFHNFEYVRLLNETFADYARTWKVSNNYYAPYSAIVNASMTGKSRMLDEISKEGVFTFTVCLRPQHEHYYRPPRTPRIADWLLQRPGPDLLAVTAEYCAFFEACLTMLDRWLQVKITDHLPTRDPVRLAIEWQHEVASPSFWDHVMFEVDKRKELILSPEDKFVPLIDGGPNTIGVVQYFKENRLNQIVVNIEKHMHLLLGTKQLPSDSLHILFIFDEARKMIDAGSFVPFRRSMRVFPSSSSSQLNIFCTMTDTASKVSNLAPAKPYDPSERANGVGMDLFSPFTVIKSLDLWWDQARHIPVHSLPPESFNASEKIVDEVLAVLMNRSACPQTPNQPGTIPFGSILNMRLLDRLDVAAMFGRPAFLSFLYFRNQVNEDVGGNKALINLMQAKLAKMPSMKIPKDITDDALVAILGHLVSIEVCASSRSAANMASGHMRLVAAVSCDRQSVFTLETAEPVLALAAHELIRSNKITWDALLSKFIDLELSTATMTGFRGEVGIQVLIIMAMQKWLFAQLDHNRVPELTLPSVDMWNYLSILLGGIDERNLDSNATGLKNDLMRMYVRPYQVVKTFVEPTTKMLYEGFIRGNAIYCRENQKAVDALVPVFLPKDNFDPQTEPVFEDRITALAFQVKLRKRYVPESVKAEWEEKLKDLPLVSELQCRGIPQVAVYVELGGSQAKTAPPSVKQIKLESGPQIKKTSYGYAVHVKDLSVLSIFPEQITANEVFKRVLESMIDPSDTTKVAVNMHRHIREMFKTQPYMTAAAKSEY